MFPFYTLSQPLLFISISVSRSVFYGHRHLWSNILLVALCIVVVSAAYVNVLCLVICTLHVYAAHSVGLPLFTSARLIECLIVILFVATGYFESVVKWQELCPLLTNKLIKQHK